MADLVISVRTCVHCNSFSMRMDNLTGGATSCCHPLKLRLSQASQFFSAQFAVAIAQANIGERLFDDS